MWSLVVGHCIMILLGMPTYEVHVWPFKILSDLKCPLAREQPMLITKDPVIFENRFRLDGQCYTS